MQITLVSDVAGRLARSIEGAPRVTAAAVALPTGAVSAIRGRLPISMPKWSACCPDHVHAMMEVLVSEGLAISVCSWDRDTQIWDAFWSESNEVCERITRADRKRVSFAKPANMARIVLMSGVMAVATARAIAKHDPRIVDQSGYKNIERLLILDTEFQGDEMLQYARQLWTGEHPWIKVRAAGYRITTKELTFATEQQDRLLLLADYAAGLAHCALIDEPGRLRLPLSNLQAREQLAPLLESGLIHISDEVFNLSCNEIFELPPT